MRIVIILALILIAAACGGDDTGIEQRDYECTTEGKFRCITIDGMPCIIWAEKRGDGEATYAYSGLTCDWRDR